MSELWAQLKGKKTYLLGAVCIAADLLSAWAESLQNRPVDWMQVSHRILACLTTMALRHGVSEANGNGNATPKPADDPRKEVVQGELYDR